jgi:threonine dehydratase
MQRMLWDLRVVVEPAAAAAPAALLFHERLRGLGATVCCIITGGNISQKMLREVVNRS